MKALVLKALDQPLRLEERPDLEPAPGRAIVALRAAALNRRDYWITRGLYPGIRAPVVLGSDGAGVVVRTGEGVDPAWRGREVLIYPGLGWGDDPAAQGREFRVLGMPEDGTFATEVSVEESQLVPRPGHLGWIEAAALPLAGLTAYRALIVQGGLRAGETVLVTGVGGGVAAFLLQFAVAHGSRVLVTSSSEAKIGRALELGAAAGYDYRRDDWAKRLRSEQGPVHLTVDGAGGPGFGALIDLTAPGGRVVSYGATAGAPERLDLFKIFWRQLRLVGSTLGSPEDFRALLDFVERHRLEPIVDRVAPLRDGPGAIASMETSGQFGKIVLDPTAS